MGIEKEGSFTLSPLSLAVFPLACHRLLKAGPISHPRFRIRLPNQYLSRAAVQRFADEVQMVQIHPFGDFVVVVADCSGANARGACQICLRPFQLA